MAEHGLLEKIIGTLLELLHTSKDPGKACDRVTHGLLCEFHVAAGPAEPGTFCHVIMYG